MSNLRSGGRATSFYAKVVQEVAGEADGGPSQKDADIQTLGEQTVRQTRRLVSRETPPPLRRYVDSFPVLHILIVSVSATYAR